VAVLEEVAGQITVQQKRAKSEPLEVAVEPANLWMVKAVQEEAEAVALLMDLVLEEAVFAVTAVLPAVVRTQEAVDQVGAVALMELMVQVPP
jgi:hypothetical protein